MKAHISRKNAAGKQFLRKPARKTAAKKRAEKPARSSPASRSLKGTRRLGESLNEMKERLDRLERKLKGLSAQKSALLNVRRELKNDRDRFEEEIETLEAKQSELDQRMTAVVKASNDAVSIVNRMLKDNELKQLGKTSGMRTGLGVLADRGGAEPIDANASRVLGRRKGRDEPE